MAAGKKGEKGRAMDFESPCNEKIHGFNVNVNIVETGRVKEEACILERLCRTSLLDKSNCCENQDGKFFRTGQGPGLVKRANF